MTIGGTLQNPIKSGFSKFFVEMACTFFYLGKFPKAPGTVGTLGAIPLVYLLAQGGDVFYLLTTLVLILVSIYLCELYERFFQKHDPGAIVIDEVVGYLVAMALLPLAWQSFLLAFILFRILDIFKPSLIGTLDRKLKGGFGVVADDLMAGVMVNVIMQLIYLNTPWLGSQLEKQAGVIW
ncbi:MAG: phosphatidylglycerophosphatase A [Bdellovibrionaceae bacterium]|jgi:phosphatidylglycerophosphatase A|nr:phosphatidylglycerophosphatase A [Pseudobdellovibrionaceae bacterium]